MQDGENLHCHCRLLSPAPARLERRRYRTPDCQRDWYIAAWFLKTGENVEYHECHPFESHFILALWSMPDDWEIDKFEERPYHRMPMTLTVLGPTDTDAKQPKAENDLD